MFKDYSMNNVDESQIEKYICDYVLVPVLREFNIKLYN